MQKKSDPKSHFDTTVTYVWPAAVSCSSVSYRLGGVDRCIFVTGKPHRAWVVVHGSVHGAG